MVDAEDGADAHVHIDVAAAIQRVHRHHVLAAIVEVDDVVVLFAGHGAHRTLSLHHADEEVVGVYVQLLLLLALHVLGAFRAQDVGHQAGLVHLAVHDLGRQPEGGEQRAQITRGTGEFALTFDDELGKGLDLGHVLLAGALAGAMVQRCGGLSFVRMNNVIRRAEARDVPRMLELVHELALFERAPQEVTVTVDHMRDAGFGSDPVWVGWVAESEGVIVGMAVCYERYSTWKGRRLYLEDIVVTESARGTRIGEKLFRQCAAYAVEKDYSGMLWQVLDWNVDAQRFYDRFGANYAKEWWNGSLEKDALVALTTDR